MLNLYLIRNGELEKLDDNNSEVVGCHDFSMKKARDNFKQITEVFSCELDVDILIAGSDTCWEDLWKGYDLPQWVCAVSTDTAVYMKAKDLWKSTNIGTFCESMMHEVVHYYVENLKTDTVPLWLNESLAIELSGQDKYYSHMNTLGIPFDTLDYGHPHVYDLSISKLKSLLEKYSLEEIIDQYIVGR